MSDLKDFLDNCFDKVNQKGVNITGALRSSLPDKIEAINTHDYSPLYAPLGDVLGETVSNATDAINKIKTIKEAERQAILSKGTFVTLTDKFDAKS